MGADISSSFDQIQLQFITGYWRVHSAINKVTNENVSLWVFDYELINSKNRPKSEVDKSIASCIYSIQQIKKIHHPNILKIKEVNENPKKLAFSAEPINSCLLNEFNVPNDEIEYIGKQLISVLSFLHNDVGIALLGLSNKSIVLDKELTIKIWEFNFSSKIVGEYCKVFPKYGNWNPSIFLPDVNFAAPEVTLNDPITNAADIFSFGVIIASLYMNRNLFSAFSPQEIKRILTGEFRLTLHYASDKMCALIRQCLNLTPESRPTISQLDLSRPFNTIPIKVYQYISGMLTKTPADKFNFYRSLNNSLNLFSKRTLKNKFLPIFMDETLKDNRYGPVTIPLIFQIGSLYEKNEFYTKILVPLNNLLTIRNPPEMMVSVFTTLDILIDRISPEKHYEIIYPIFSSALKSNEPKLQICAIGFLPKILKTLSPTVIKEDVIPKLTDFISDSDSDEIVAYSILTLSECLLKIDPELFTEITLPKLVSLWERLHSNTIASAIISIIEKLEIDSNLALQYAIPLASQMLLTPQYLTLQLQAKLVSFTQNIFTNLITERKLDKKPKAQILKQIDKPKPISRKSQASTTKKDGPSQDFWE